jgi:hypothetical protein
MRVGLGSYPAGPPNTSILMNGDREVNILNNERECVLASDVKR